MTAFTSTPSWQIVVLDDRRLYREGLTSILDDAGFTVLSLEVLDRKCPTSVVMIIGEVHVLPPMNDVQIVRLSDVKSGRHLVELLMTNTFPRVQELELAPTSLLTDREREVLEAVSVGRSAREIATSLGISPRTVERYMQSILTKLDVRSQAEAVATYMSLGLLSADS